MNALALMGFAAFAYWFSGWDSLSRSIEHFVSGVPIPTGSIGS